MKIDIIDKSGQPRSEEDVLEALNAVKKEIILFRLPPEFFVLLPTIKTCLEELIQRRKFNEDFDGSLAP